MALDLDEFAEECARSAIAERVLPEYMVAVAKVRSGISEGSSAKGFGPFGLSQAQWDSAIKDKRLSDFKSDDIKFADMQVPVFAVMTSLAEDALRQKTGQDINMIELYNAQWPDDKITSADLDAALKAIEPAVTKAMKKIGAEFAAMTDSNAPMPGGGAMPKGAGGILGELISSGEGDYNSFNHGVAGDSKGQKIDFSKMTLASIMAEQAKPRGDPTRLFAVGKYQVVPDTMKEARAALNLDTSRPFTPRVQEEIFRRFLVGSKRPQVKNFITGKSGDLKAAQLALAQEFASVADPNTGKSFFDKQAGNSSSITAAQSGKALNDERAAFSKLVAAGKSEADAWLALSPGLA